MWEDTLMDEERMLGCSLRGKYCFEEVKDVILDTSIAQAKITWDETINEVVEWIDKRLYGSLAEGYRLVQMTNDEWLTQKKVWGIE